MHTCLAPNPLSVLILFSTQKDCFIERYTSKHGRGMLFLPVTYDQHYMPLFSCTHSDASSHGKQTPTHTPTHTQTQLFMHQQSPWSLTNNYTLTHVLARIYIQTCTGNCSKVTLPSNFTLAQMTQALHNQLLQGKYVLQIDEVVNLGAPARDRCEWISVKQGFHGG